MSGLGAAARVAGFALVLAVVFVAMLGVGRAVGPVVDAEPEPTHAPAPAPSPTHGEEHR